MVGTTRSDDFQLGSYNDSRPVLICEGEGTDSDSSDAAPQARGPRDGGKVKRLYKKRSSAVEKDATKKRHSFEKREGKGATSRVVGDHGTVRGAARGQQARGGRSGSAPPGGSGASGGRSGASGVGVGGPAGSSSIGSGSGQGQGGSGDGGGRRDGSGKRKFDGSDERAGGSRRRRSRRVTKKSRTNDEMVTEIRQQVMKL